MKRIIGRGIDVSRWQGDINWRKVAESGIGYAMLKASQGEGITAKDGRSFSDITFVQNVNGAYGAGIKCGAYHYACFADRERAKREYEYFFSILKPYKEKIGLYAALDLEEKVFADQKRKAENTDLVLLFTKIAIANGFIPALYTNNNFLTYYLENQRLKDIAIWKAHYYTPRKDSPIPTEPENIVMWQWSEKGRVDGIDTEVDLNLVFEVPDIYDLTDDLKERFYVEKEKIKEIGYKIADILDIITHLTEK